MLRKYSLELRRKSVLCQQCADYEVNPQIQYLYGFSRITLLPKVLKTAPCGHVGDTTKPF